MNNLLRINSNPFPAGIATLLRYVLTALGGLLVSRGYFSQDALNDVVGALLIIIPACYGLYKTVANKQKLVEAATTPPELIDIR